MPAGTARTASRNGLVDFLALGADREALWGTVGYPHLSAERDHGSTGDGALEDLVLCHIVGKPLVIAIAVRQLWLRVALGNDLCAHERQFTRRGQFNEGSSGNVATRARSPPCRRKTPGHSRSGSAANASPGSAASTYQAPSSISAWSWPLPQPAYPAKMRKLTISAAKISGGASRSTSPIRDMIGVPSSGRQPSGSPSPGTRARATALSGDTGPPLNTTAGPVTRSVHDSSTWATGTWVGRFSTTPSVPSSRSCSTTSTTARRKFGSPSIGVATSNRPTSVLSCIASSWYLPHGICGAAVQRHSGGLTPMVSPPVARCVKDARSRSVAASRTAAATVDATLGWKT